MEHTLITNFLITLVLGAVGSGGFIVCSALNGMYQWNMKKQNRPVDRKIVTRYYIGMGVFFLLTLASVILLSVSRS